MALRIPAKVMIRVRSSHFSLHDVIRWKTAATYDKHFMALSMFISNYRQLNCISLLPDKNYGLDKSRNFTSQYNATI